MNDWIKGKSSSIYYLKKKLNLKENGLIRLNVKVIINIYKTWIVFKKKVNICRMERRSKIIL